ncbi:MAG: 4-hydroxy-3-methylbut-2-enyl diphosphate reductase [Bacteroidales bacterium]|nr:4-hydroxy-3-methylbut-2-enyl diphosphate reductase [Bacteroidales bacterium]
MRILIDDNAGFCFGVVRAIDTAEKHLEQEGTLCCLGDIVHNNAEVQRLKEKGLRVIDSLDIIHTPQSLRDSSPNLGEQRLPQAKVLIRAHGEPPSTYARAKELGITLIDATCPIVLALQQKIKKGYEEMQATTPQGQVVIFGKPGHAEVIGLCGQTAGTAVVVSHPDDLEAVDFTRPIRLYSQTTKNKEEYRRLIENIKARMACSNESPDFIAYDTICNQVANRATQLEAFARSVDAVVFVSGKGSSNGHYLYEYCKSVQPHTTMITDVQELEGIDLKGVQTVGITGATSTPRWLMEAVAHALTH